MTERERQFLKQERYDRYLVVLYFLLYCVLQFAVAVMIYLGVGAVWTLLTFCVSHLLQIATLRQAQHCGLC